MNHTAKDHCFGRNLDLEFSYHKRSPSPPRNHPFPFTMVNDLATHRAIIGMTTVADGYPLYYDATNEKGLSMAGLNSSENADDKPEEPGKDNASMSTAQPESQFSGAASEPSACRATSPRCPAS